MGDRSAAVIMPVWNGRAWLEQCLDALRRQQYAPMEIIVVDNASTDGSAELIGARYPDVTLLRQSCNRGFAAACNIGLSHAGDADVRVLLNQDTEVQTGWLQALVDALAADAQLGMAGSKALYPDGTIQHAGAVLDPQTGGRHLGAGEVDDGRFDRPTDVDFLSGVSLAITAPAYAAVGGLDEAFEIAYFEDADWCYRARAAGFGLAYVPASTLIHHEESRAGGESFAAIHRYQRNRLRLLLKHWPVQRLQKEFLPAERAWLSRQLSAVFVGATQQAYHDHLLRLDEMMAWRRQFLGAEAGSAAAIAELLATLRLTYAVAPAFPPADGRPAAPTRFENLLAALMQQAAAQPSVPRSGVPVLGPLIDGLRRLWSRIGADPHVYGALEQQRRLNRTLLEALAESERERRWVAETLVEYARTNARETGSLTDELRRLRHGQANAPATGVLAKEPAAPAEPQT